MPMLRAVKLKVPFILKARTGTSVCHAHLTPVSLCNTDGRSTSVFIWEIIDKTAARLSFELRQEVVCPHCFVMAPAARAVGGFCW